MDRKIASSSRKHSPRALHNKKNTHTHTHIGLSTCHRQSSKRRLLIDWRDPLAAGGGPSPPRWLFETKRKNTTYRRSVPLVRPIWPCRRCPPVQTLSDDDGFIQHNTITAVEQTPKQNGCRVVARRVVPLKQNGAHPPHYARGIRRFSSSAFGVWCMRRIGHGAEFEFVWLMVVVWWGVYNQFFFLMMGWKAVHF